MDVPKRAFGHPHREVGTRELAANPTRRFADEEHSLLVLEQPSDLGDAEPPPLSDLPRCVMRLPGEPRYRPEPVICRAAHIRRGASDYFGR